MELSHPVPAVDPVCSVQHRGLAAAQAATFQVPHPHVCPSVRRMTRPHDARAAQPYLCRTYSSVFARGCRINGRGVVSAYGLTAGREVPQLVACIWPDRLPDYA